MKSMQDRLKATHDLFKSNEIDARLIQIDARAIQIELFKSIEIEVCLSEVYRLFASVIGNNQVTGTNQDLVVASHSHSRMAAKVEWLPASWWP